jgi:hypothetical protein
MNSLTNTKKPWGKITFIHHRTGEEHSFYSCVNKLTNDRLSAFDNEPPSIGDNMTWVKSVFRDIKTKCKILSIEGNIG